MQAQLDTKLRCLAEKLPHFIRRIAKTSMDSIFAVQQDCLQQPDVSGFGEVIQASQCANKVRLRITDRVCHSLGGDGPECKYNVEGKCTGSIPLIQGWIGIHLLDHLHKSRPMKQRKRQMPVSEVSVDQWHRERLVHKGCRLQGRRYSHPVGSGAVGRHSSE